MRIDRIIFVASAAKNEALPLKLMKCVIAVAQPDKPHGSYVTRNIPLFGMITKIDTVDTSEEKFRNKEVAFRRGLGIYGSTRYGCCSTYCSGIYQPGEEIGSILPRLNVPILKFLIAVFSPSATEVVSQCEPPMTSTESQTEQQIVEKQTLEFPSYLIRTAIRLLAFAVFIGVCIIYSPVLPKNVRRECGMMTKNENITEINKICEASINNEMAFITYTSVYQMLAIALYILFELIFELLLYLF
ncbi:hypothetical protein KUTeg_024950 [Tegillarca granosa]|uniref:Uncharacterized protein n=1 Tax=Tegillarca granosa TaxID=220873 RepID=A0ABQ9DZC1_TEGGR|nr:hypothetical protein KUTeg_024950 [Tegillarca granosa]